MQETKTQETPTTHGLSAKKQIILIFLCWLMYVASYVGRYSYNSNITAIQTAFSLGKYSSTGLVTTCFFFAYGAGQVVNGLLCKYPWYNKRYVLSVALAVCALVNLTVFLGADFVFFKWLWLINGAALSTLWCSLILTLSENLETKRLKTAILVMGTTVASGTVVAYGLSALFALFDGWRFTFLVAAIVTAVVAVVWLIFYNGLVLPREERAAVQKSEAVDEGGERMSKTVLWLMLGALAIFSVVNNLIKDGLMTWVPSILKDRYGFGDSLSIILALALPLVGFFGVLLVSELKKKTNSFVLISGFLYAVTFLGLLGVLGSYGLSTFIPLLVCFALSYCFMSGVNNVVTASAPLYLRREVNSGVLAGVLDGFCYLGSTISSYGLGKFADFAGWKAVFVLLTVCAAVSVVVAAAFLIWEQTRKRKK